MANLPHCIPCWKAGRKASHWADDPVEHPNSTRVRPEPLSVVGKNGAAADLPEVLIGRLYTRVRAGIVESMTMVVEIGQRLRKQKTSLKHGEWLPWLEKHEKELGFGERTATAMMKAAKSAVTADLTEAQATEISRLIWGNTPKLEAPKAKPKPASPRAAPAFGTPKSDDDVIEVLKPKNNTRRTKKTKHCATCRCFS